jgi:hypothetical protein
MDHDPAESLEQAGMAITMVKKERDGSCSHE